jgi:murein DD-endopeptidase MepM/ murein hydrolase activator NlpD
MESEVRVQLGSSIYQINLTENIDEFEAISLTDFGGQVDDTTTLGNLFALSSGISFASRVFSGSDQGLLGTRDQLAVSISRLEQIQILSSAADTVASLGGDLTSFVITRNTTSLAESLSLYLIDNSVDELVAGIFRNTLDSLYADGSEAAVNAYQAIRFIEQNQLTGDFVTEEFVREMVSDSLVATSEFIAAAQLIAESELLDGSFWSDLGNFFIEFGLSVSGGAVEGLGGSGVQIKLVEGLTLIDWTVNQSEAALEAAQLYETYYAEIDNNVPAVLGSMTQSSIAQYIEFFQGDGTPNDSGSENGSNGQNSSSVFVQPVDEGYTLTQEHNEPSTGLYPSISGTAYHIGQDWANGSVGGLVYSIGAGTVVYAGFVSGFGPNYVVVEHELPDGTAATSYYGHMDSKLVSVGQEVAVGEQIGTVGDEGLGTGAHLHFAIFLGDGAPVNDPGAVSSPDPDITDRFVDPTWFFEYTANNFEAPSFPEDGVSDTISFADASDEFDADGGSEVAKLFLESLGITVDNVTYTGSNNAAFLVSEFEIPGTSIDYQGGILLSSGGFPGPSNTDPGFTVVHGTTGDSDLDIVAQEAFPNAGQTQDASILEFRLFVDDPSQLSFDLVFGSDEYPEFANSDFVDVAAVFVNGENVALFPGSDVPLSITNENVLNNLADNRNGNFAIEWDGFAALGLTANLDAGWNDIKVGVADTGDTSLDTAIYLTDFELTARDQDDDAPAGEVRLKNVGGPLDNSLVASNTPEEHTFYEPSSPAQPNVPGSLSGTSSSFNNDIVTNFKSDDEIKIIQLQQIQLLKQAVELLQQLINIKKGSAIVEIDEDLDGTVDSVLTLEGDFENSRFNVEIVEDDVVLTLEELGMTEGSEDGEIAVNYVQWVAPSDAPVGVESPLGTDGPDDIFNPLGGQSFALGGGADVVRGPVANFFDDVIDDFGLDDTMVFEGTEIARSAIDVTFGSAILDVDTDGDGSSNGQFTLEGDFSAGDFMAVVDSGDTMVTFETFLPALQEGQALDPNLVNGIINQNFLKGDGSSDFQITLRDMGFAGYDNTIGVYEIDASGNIIDTRILFENANADKSAIAGITDVEAGNRLGFFIVQDAADWAATLAAGDTLSFVDSSGSAANILDGSDISIAVNGIAVDEMVFHSFSENMNFDGVQHALSGVDVGGQSISVGFEDLTGGGDQDYEDVVFRVEPVDDFMFI